ncbi:MAG: ParB N-terminal domain-containing protein [Spirochaetes bacterium]|nr:ParB N-terminal domain-containing protein [Spirochaetota bacterium]
MKISDLKPAPYNPRKDLKPGDPEYDKLKKAIIEFDYIDPVIINQRNNTVIGGHQRLKILKELGHIEIDVSVVDLDAAKEKALNIALNKTGGEFDIPMLSDLLLELDAEDFDIEVTGFGAEEIGIEDITEVDSFNEKFNLSISCEDLTELAIIQNLLGVTGKKIGANKVIEMLS